MGKAFPWLQPAQKAALVYATPSQVGLLPRGHTKEGEYYSLFISTPACEQVEIGIGIAIVLINIKTFSIITCFFYIMHIIATNETVFVQLRDLIFFFNKFPIRNIK